MKRILATLLFLIPIAALAGTKTVTELTWTNPTTNTDVTSILVTCGTTTYSDTSASAIAAGQSAAIPLGTLMTPGGTYTCSVQAINANGASVPSNSTPPITNVSGVFTIAVPDAPTGLSVN